MREFGVWASAKVTSKRQTERPYRAANVIDKTRVLPKGESSSGGTRNGPAGPCVAAPTITKFHQVFFQLTDSNSRTPSSDPLIGQGATLSAAKSVHNGTTYCKRRSDSKAANRSNIRNVGQSRDPQRHPGPWTRPRCDSLHQQPLDVGHSSTCPRDHPRHPGQRGRSLLGERQQAKTIEER